MIALITSHLFLIISLLTDSSETFGFDVLDLAWGLGIVSVITNGVYAIKINVSELTLSTFGLCGIVWFAPFFIDKSYGIASLVIFLIIAIYIHWKPIPKKEKTA